MEELIDWKLILGVTLLLQGMLYVIKKKVRHAYQIAQSYRILRKIRSIDSNAARLAYVKKIDPYVFEECILSSLKQKGFKIKRNHRYSGDGGVDGIAWIDGQRHLIQAKCYKDYISKKHVLDFCALTRKTKSQGIFVHTGKTPDTVFELLYKEPQVTLVSGEKLIKFFTV